MRSLKDLRTRGVPREAPTISLESRQNNSYLANKREEEGGGGRGAQSASSALRPGMGGGLQEGSHAIRRKDKNDKAATGKERARRLYTTISPSTLTRFAAGPCSSPSFLRAVPVISCASTLKKGPEGRTAPGQLRSRARTCSRS